MTSAPHLFACKASALCAGETGGKIGVLKMKNSGFFLLDADFQTLSRWDFFLPDAIFRIFFFADLEFPDFFHEPKKVDFEVAQSQFHHFRNAFPPLTVRFSARALCDPKKGF